MKLSTAFLGSSLLLSSFSSAFAAEVVGRANLTYTDLYAIGLSGEPRYEQYDSSCKNLLGALLNTRASVDYSINTETGMQTAYFNYMGTRSKMSSMGLTNAYAFVGSVSGAPTLLDVGLKNVFFQMDKQFEKHASLFTFSVSEEGQNANPQFQCILATEPY